MRSFALTLLVALPALASSAGLVPVSPYLTEPAAGNQAMPSIAEGPDGFLATWVDRRDGSDGDLRASRLDHEGDPVEPSGILLDHDHDADGLSITSHRAFWTGSEWVVLYLRGDTLSAARLGGDGTILQASRPVVSGPDVPKDTFDAITVSGRIVVAGPATNGASMLVLDVTGALLTGPVIVEKTTPQRQIRTVLAASLGDAVLLADLAAYACSTCPTLIAHRMSLGAQETGRSTPSGIEDKPRVYALAPFGNGYLLVGQDTGARVESWRLSAGMATVDAHEVISAVPRFAFQGSLLLQSALTHGHMLYFAPEVAQGEPKLRLAQIGGDGKATPVAFDVADATGGELDMVASTWGTVALITRRNASGDTDIVVRTAAGIDAIQQAPSREVVLSAPEQSAARSVRNGQETLVSWVERRHGETTGGLFATRLDAAGRPVGSGPVRLLDAGIPYAIGANGTDYLVVRSLASSVSARRLNARLEWVDLAWVPVASKGCGELNEHSVVWDGGGWWVGWVGCGDNPQVELRRLNRDLISITPLVTLQSDEPRPPMLATMEGSVVALWFGAPPACPILCPPALRELRAARVSSSGSVIVAPVKIADDVQVGLFDFASRGSELFAVWASADRTFASRITKDLVALDTAWDGNATQGKLIDAAGLDSIDLGWDGSRWVAASHAVYYKPELHRLATFRSFAPGSDPATMWSDAATRDLGEPAPGFPLALSAASAGATLVLQPLSNESTTGVYRYFSRNMSSPARTRGVRR